jgi:hypothetical protein
VIFKNDPPPAYTSTLTGLKNGDNPTVSHITSPVYIQGSPAGVYTIIPSLPSFANAGNYIITFINGTLYVNPKGPGAKKLIPKLDCVVEIANPLPGQYRFIARFTCDNNNATPVYVPVGPDNNLSSQSGSFNGSAQPVLFNPGITSFAAPFDGIKLTWVVKTFETDHKTSVATDASSGSGRCSNNNITQALRSGEIINETDESGPFKTTVSPNPATNRIAVNTKEILPEELSVTIYDVNGRSCPVKINRRISAYSVELDISGFQKGFYIIRLKTADGYKTVRIIKQ